MDKIPLAPVGQWTSWVQLPSHDPAAEAFSPPFFDRKPTLYMGVKRRQSVDTFPQLVIHIQILEEDQRYNVNVPAWTGAAVHVTVRNIFSGNVPVTTTTTLTGKDSSSRSTGKRGSRQHGVHGFPALLRRSGRRL